MHRFTPKFQILYKISINIHVKFGEVLFSILPKLTGTKFCQSSSTQNLLNLHNFLNFDLFLPINPFPCPVITLLALFADFSIN